MKIAGFFLLLFMTPFVGAMDEKTSLFNEKSELNEKSVKETVIKIEEKLINTHKVLRDDTLLHNIQDPVENRPSWWHKNKKYVLYTGGNVMKYAFYVFMLASIGKYSIHRIKNCNKGIVPPGEHDCSLFPWEICLSVFIAALMEASMIDEQRRCCTSIENRKAALIYVVSALLAAGIIIPVVLFT